MLKPAVLLPVLGVVVSLAAVVSSAIDVWRQRAETFRASEQLALTLADMSAEHLARTFETIDRTLADAAGDFEDHRRGLLGTGEDARQRLSDALRATLNGSPTIIGLAIVDAAGDRFAQASSPRRITLNVRSQPQFTAHVEAPRDELFIAPPFRSAVDGQWIVLASRGLRAPDGAFMGIVQASINLDHLVRTYSRLQLIDGGIVSLFMRDSGTFLLYGAETAAQLGRRVVDPSAFAGEPDLRRAARQFRGTAIDGIDRLIAHRAVPGFPLVVAVGFTVDDVLAGWRSDILPRLAMTLLPAILFTIAMFHVGRSFARREAALVSATRATAASNAKSEFLATISHEIRTPLNGILGYAELLGATQLSQPQRTQVDVIVRSARSLQGLLDDVLDFSRIETGNLELLAEPFDPRQVVEDALAAVRPSAQQESLELVCDLPMTLPRLEGDGGRLGQVVLNLLSNAVKFTAKGQVRLGMTVQLAPRGRARLRCEVTDTGIGIDQDALPHLFQRFAQADSTIGRRFGGTGLGLAISRRIVERMGGEIGVDSAPGVGSRFWFVVELPLAPAIAAADERNAAPAAAAQRTAQRVLVVDDMEVNRTLASVILGQAGHHVDAVDGGEAALRFLASTPVDVVLMDVNMPGMDGFETTARIRSLPSDAARVRVVALTASATTSDIAHCRQVGMDGHIAKPIDRNQLLRAVESPARWIAPSAVGFERELEIDHDGSVLDGAHLDELERHVDRALVRRMVTLACERFADAEPRLTQNLDARAWAALAAEAHAIVSMSANLGALALSARFRRVETMARLAAAGAPPADADAAERELRTIIDEALPHLRSACDALRRRYVEETT